MFNLVFNEDVLYFLTLYVLISAVRFLFLKGEVKNNAVSSRYT